MCLFALKDKSRSEHWRSLAEWSHFGTRLQCHRCQKGRLLIVSYVMVYLFLSRLGEYGTKVWHCSCVKDDNSDWIFCGFMYLAVSLARDFNAALSMKAALQVALRPYVRLSVAYGFLTPECQVVKLVNSFLWHVGALDTLDMEEHRRLICLNVLLLLLDYLRFCFARIWKGSCSWPFDSLRHWHT